MATKKPVVPESEPAAINVQRIGRQEVRIRIQGTAPLVVSRFSEKARRMMLDAQQGRKKVKEVRDPEADFHAARHRIGDGEGWDGFPAPGLKGAIVGGARFFQDKKLNMTLLKQSVLVQGEGDDMLVPIYADADCSKRYGVDVEPVMREDLVRNATGVADFRFRPQYMPWFMNLQILYVPTLMSVETVIALVDAGGFVGIGEGRPGSRMSQTGTWGTFQVDMTKDIELVKGGE
jgi:hypothetical protein